MLIIDLRRTQLSFYILVQFTIMRNLKEKIKCVESSIQGSQSETKILVFEVISAGLQCNPRHPNCLPWVLFLWCPLQGSNTNLDVPLEMPLRGKLLPFQEWNSILLTILVFLTQYFPCILQTLENVWTGELFRLRYGLRGCLDPIP